MKIICTKTEKENLSDSVNSSAFCPFGHDCMGFNCERCFEENVEWEITDGSGSLHEN